MREAHVFISFVEDLSGGGGEEEEVYGHPDYRVFRTDCNKALLDKNEGYASPAGHVGLISHKLNIIKW